MGIAVDCRDGFAGVYVWVLKQSHLEFQPEHTRHGLVQGLHIEPSVPCSVEKAHICVATEINVCSGI